jgi:hypothetical protein
VSPLDSAVRTQGTTEWGNLLLGPSITQYFVRSIRATCFQSSGRRDSRALARGISQASVAVVALC